VPNIYTILNPLKPRSKKQVPALIIASFLCVFWFITFLASKEHQLGKCKAWNGQFYENVPCNWDVHPVYGTPVFKVTAENIPIFNLKKINADGNTVFFDPVERKPRVYFYKSPSRGIEFYNAKGIHPQFGEELKPVTKEIIEEFLKDYSENGTKKATIPPKQERPSSNINPTDKPATTNNSNVSQLSSEQEKELIDIAYNHFTISIRDKAAKELIKKSKRQEVIINLAYNHFTISIRNEAAEKLIEKSDDKAVIRKLAKEHFTISIRDKAAQKLMNWHSIANNYFH
jgi:hypothetical protein